MIHRTNTNRSAKETIRGVVVPSQWDREFQVTGFLIACPDEREVRVGNLESFPMLKLLERSEVELTGTVQMEGLAETIVIDKLRPLNS